MAPSVLQEFGDQQLPYFSMQFGDFCRGGIEERFFVAVDLGRQFGFKDRQFRHKCKESVSIQFQLVNGLQEAGKRGILTKDFLKTHLTAGLKPHLFQPQLANPGGYTPELLGQFGCPGKQMGMDRAVAGQYQAKGEGPAVGLLTLADKRLAHRAVHTLYAVALGQINPVLSPTQHIERPFLNLCYSSLLDRHHGDTLGALFPNMAPLEIAGKDDPRFNAHDFPPVHMAKRPIIIARCLQFGDGAGCVSLMSCPTGKRGMQEADIDIAGFLAGISGKQIVGHGAEGIALAMDDGPQLLQFFRLGLSRRKNRDILRPRHGLGELTGGVVIAGYNKNLDPGLGQAAHPPGEIEAGIVVLPIAVIEIAGDKEKGNRLVDGQVDECVKSPSRRPANLGNRRIVVRLKPPERAIEVNIGGVNEFIHTI